MARQETDRRVHETREYPEVGDIVIRRHEPNGIRFGVRMYLYSLTWNGRVIWDSFMSDGGDLDLVLRNMALSWDYLMEQDRKLGFPWYEHRYTADQRAWAQSADRAAVVEYLRIWNPE